MENFVHTLSAIPFLTENDISSFLAICQSKSLSKGDHWTREGHYADKIAFIEKGYLRKYYHKAEKEITDNFYFENSITADIPSIITKHSPFANTIAMEDSELTW